MKISSRFCRVKNIDVNFYNMNYQYALPRREAKELIYK